MWRTYGFKNRVGAGGGDTKRHVFFAYAPYDAICPPLVDPWLGEVVGTSLGLERASNQPHLALGAIWEVIRCSDDAPSAHRVSSRSLTCDTFFSKINTSTPLFYGNHTASAGPLMYSCHKKRCPCIQFREKGIASQRPTSVLTRCADRAPSDSEHRMTSQMAPRARRGCSMALPSTSEVPTTSPSHGAWVHQC